MWEHCVLNELHGQLQTRTVHYWRDKRGHGIDFIIANKSQQNLTAIECKFNSSSEDSIQVSLASLAKNFEVFRTHYPDGDNFIVSHNTDTSFKRKYKDITIHFVNVKDLIKNLKRPVV